MINVYSVLIKPLYTVKHVERLYKMIASCLRKEFKFICLTDRDESSELPIEFIRIDQYELDTWWNKVLVFKEGISGEGLNIYFDLDVNVFGVQSLLDDIAGEDLFVVDTFWKDEVWLKDSLNSVKPRVEAFIGTGYGNTSVMGWMGLSHNFLAQMLLDEVYKHTTEHYGDDTFINKYANIKYFKRVITKEDAPFVRDENGNRVQIAKPRVVTHVKSVLTDPELKVDAR